MVMNNRLCKPSERTEEIMPCHVIETFQKSCFVSLAACVAFLSHCIGSESHSHKLKHTFPDAEEMSCFICCSLIGKMSDLWNVWVSPWNQHNPNW